MKHENRLIDAIIDLSQEMKGMRKDMNQQLGELNQKVGELNQRVGKLEKQQAITNLELREVRLSNMKIDKRLEDTYLNHEKRIHKLEQIVLK